VSYPNVIQSTFDEFAKGIGGSKKSGSWYLRGTETIVVLNLQKSQYGLQYYVNVGVWLRALGENEAPKGTDCQIQTRLEGLVPAELENRLTELLNLDYDLDEVGRQQALLRLLRDHLFPLIVASSTLESLQAGAGRELVRKSLVTGPGQGLLAGGTQNHANDR
jgi:Domain of unknown function (DUF4304)